MPKQLMTGNEALLKGAILAGCRAFYGYPITPANEITEAAAFYLPKAGGVFLQAESEVAAINMVYGAAACGVRAMTASSGPGASLMQEGISYLAAAELPAVIASITRGGPGLGNLFPEQSDYFQMVKGGGHGSYRNLVLAPASAQEMADLSLLAFDLACRYRNPVVILADAMIAQMMEPVMLPARAQRPSAPEWAVLGTAETRSNLVHSIHLEAEQLERHVLHMEEKYLRAAREETRWENWRTEDAEIILIGYGIVARMLKSVVERLRRGGVRAGLLRPVTLFPFPSLEIRSLSRQARLFVAVEMSLGQMVEDVRLALEGRTPLEFFGRAGGIVPEAHEVAAFVSRLVMMPSEELQQGGLQWQATS
jgi:pyruvate/2-oxoacid:ferredoxin oxidoreductase alpha subunit